MSTQKTSTARDVQRNLRAFSDPKRAQVMLRFFKTGPGQYGEGDVFIGSSVPQLRTVVRQYRDLPLGEATTLLKSKVHEDRLAAVLILNELYKRGDQAQRQKVYAAYLANTRYINNWDIIDTSAPHIVGRHLLETSTPAKRLAILKKMARSKLLWDRRISIMATQAFIRAGEFVHTFAIGQALLGDKHDLIHKAVGWMLREVGERDRAAEVAFLNKFAPRMPRTMLRYAIEKFPQPTRKKFLTAGRAAH